MQQTGWNALLYLTDKAIDFGSSELREENLVFNLASGYPS
jgi:hypothetical protein